MYRLVDSQIYDGDTQCAFVYGPGEFYPGWRYDEIADAARLGILRGAVGVAFTHRSVASYSADVRARFGGVLQLIPEGRFYVWDDLSVQWAAHYSVSAELGGDPRWLRSSDDILKGWTWDVERDGVCRVLGLEAAFKAAILGVPFVLMPQTSGELGEGHVNAIMTEHMLVRWAKRWLGNTDCVVVPREEISEEDIDALAVTISPKRLERLRAEACDTLSILFEPASCRKGNVMRLMEKLGDVAAPPCDVNTRLLRVGTRLDPETHYDDHYYGVDGKSILYPRPDGSWEAYRGTAHSWEGNKTIAGIVDRLFRSGEANADRLLDIGCGSGDFVGCMMDLDWAAIGVDISDSGKKHSRCPERIVVADIREAVVGDEFAPKQTVFAPQHVVTAFDFWEHIYIEDIEALAESVYRLLVPGGVHVACICTRGESEQDLTFTPDTTIDQQNAWCLVSGHVTIRRWFWWLKRFRAVGFEPDYMAMALFGVLRDESLGLRGVSSWGSRNVIILRRPKER